MIGVDLLAPALFYRIQRLLGDLASPNLAISSSLSL
jgi:hypothetical protein